MSTAAAAARVAGQVVLGAALMWTGTLHLTSGRKAFRAQVPSWLPADPDMVVLVSGGVELGLGGALLVAWPCANTYNAGPAPSMARQSMARRSKPIDSTSMPAAMASHCSNEFIHQNSFTTQEGCT